jgi:transcriptional regulator with XRE-family HTH domain
MRTPRQAYEAERTVLSPLRLYRLIAQLSQRELADLSGVSREAISHIERGRRARRHTMIALAEALDVEPRNLFPESDRDDA